MSGLDNLRTRLDYAGGVPAESRFIKDKEKTLKKSLLYSYQAATAILSDGREFRCLINSNKEIPEYDNKIISIPYKDINLNKDPSLGEKTSHGVEEIGLKCGDVFTWKETDTHWLVYLEYLEEDAYFRAQIRRCDQEIEIDGRKYWAYVRGPVETTIRWNQRHNMSWNDMNYSLELFVTKDEYTSQKLQRFSLLKIQDPRTGLDKTWRVAVVNPYYGDGIIQAYLEEYFENPIEEQSKEEQKQIEEQKKPDFDLWVPRIAGPDEVYAYDTASYAIENIGGGTWYIITNSKEQNFGSDTSIDIDVTLKKGSFTIEYRTVEKTISKTVIVKPM